MSRFQFFDTHRTWEDWAGIALGTAVIVSPLLFDRSVPDRALLNTMTVGVLVVALSALELVDLRRWQEWLLLALGAWLVASPWIFGYAPDGSPATWHMVLGLVVMTLASLEFWQDRTASTDELKRHGR